MTGVAINRVTRVPGRLRRFQDEFARALLVEDCAAAGFAPEIARLAAQPAFAVYRNTVMKGCIDALQANYPSIARLVGEEWFRAAAAIYARSNLPRHPTLADYGADFAGFLAAFAPAADLPYLPGVARLDRFWTEAHTARDEAPLDAAAVARLAPDELARTVLRPHASARWAWFDAQPIVTIWRRNRYPDDRRQRRHRVARRGRADRAPGRAVEHVELDAGRALSSTRARPAGRSRMPRPAALAVSAEADLARLMAQLLEAGAFGRLHVSGSPTPGARMTSATTAAASDPTGVRAAWNRVADALDRWIGHSAARARRTLRDRRDLLHVRPHEGRRLADRQRERDRAVRGRVQGAAAFARSSPRTLRRTPSTCSRSSSCSASARACPRSRYSA